MLKQGFTLIELCITTALLGIGLTLVLPGMGHLNEKIQIRACTDDIYLLIQHAKSLSVSQKKPLWLFFENDIPSSDWKLTLSDADNLSSGKILSIIDSTAYPKLSVKGAYLDNKMAFYAERGKVSSGNIAIQPRASAEYGVKIITSYGAARVRLCTQGIHSDEWPDC